MKQNYSQYNQHREVLLDIDGWSRIEVLSEDNFERVIKHGMSWRIAVRRPMSLMCVTQPVFEPVADIEMGIVTFYFSGRYIGSRPLLTTN